MTADQRPEKYKTGLRRILASVIDAGILTLPFVVISANFRTFGEGVYTGLSILNTFLPLLYSVVMHFRYGQTIGKMVVHVKVVDVSETKAIQLKQALLRDSVWIVLQVVDFALQQFLVRSDNSVFWLLTTITGNVAFLWTLLETVSMFTNSKRRAVHDFIAGTVVIQSK